LSQLP